MITIGLFINLLLLLAVLLMIHRHDKRMAQRLRKTLRND